jgi:hypothetical protein
LILEPATCLFVEESAKRAIGDCNGISWKAVKVERVCNIPYEKGVRVEHHGLRGFRSTQPERFMLKQSYSAEESASVPNFFELSAPHLENVHAANDDLRDFEVQPERGGDKTSVRVSNTLLKQYPILWHDGFHLLNEDAFSRCKDFFNWNYFECLPFEI